MTLKAFQVFTNYYYAQAQAQAQTQAGQGQFIMPFTTPFVPTPAQLVVKFSKLVKEAKQLGCETFSSTVDAITTKNGLKRDLNTLTDMEFNDELRLRVTTRLIDKSATTW